jgi:hypothetical protein
MKGMLETVEGGLGSFSLQKEYIPQVKATVQGAIQSSAKQLWVQLHKRFPDDKLLSASKVLYPQFWAGTEAPKTADVKALLKLLTDRWGARMPGKDTPPPLDSTRLQEQLAAFMNVARAAALKVTESGTKVRGRRGIASELKVKRWVGPLNHTPLSPAETCRQGRRAAHLAVLG